MSYRVAAAEAVGPAFLKPPVGWTGSRKSLSAVS
jgi:hypothetical protein